MIGFPAIFSTHHIKRYDLKLEIKIKENKENDEEKTFDIGNWISILPRHSRDLFSHWITKRFILSDPLILKKPIDDIRA